MRSIRGVASTSPAGERSGYTPRRSQFQRLAEFLGLKRSIVGVLAMVILVGMGEHMAERFLPIYLIALGGGALSIGLLNGLDNLLSALYSYPGGYLADRIGTKRSLVVFNLMAMAGFVIVIAVPTTWAVILGAVLFISWSALSLPATMGLLASVLPRNKLTMGVSMNAVVRRIPKAVGPLIGGVLIAARGEIAGIRLAFVVSLALAIVALVMQQILIEDDAKGSDRTPDHFNPVALFRMMSSPMRNLLVSDILIRFCEQIPFAFVVVWCMKVAREPVTALQFGVLNAIEMTIAILIYVPVAYFADKSTKKPFILITFVNFTVFPLALLFAQSFWPLVAAFVLRGLKEFGEPTRKALIMDLAPEGSKAGMFGVYYLLRDSVVAVAAFGGAFLWMIGPEVNLLAAFVFGISGTIWFALRGKDVARSPG